MKLFNYFDFLFEGNESPREIAKMKIYYSDRFRDLLTKIASNKSTDNETPRMVAEFLLSGEDSNQALDIYTLIDITDKNDKISFVQVNRIARDTGLKDLTSFKVGSDYKFWREGRTPEYGIGRWVRHIFVDVQKSTLNDTQLEQFVNAYKSTFDSKDKELIEIVEGEEIRNCYLEDNYEEVKGQLGNSCMRYSRCQSYLDIYVKNPEVCKLLILRGDTGKVKGRALLWTLSDGSKYIDRMYTIDDSDKIIFKEWGLKNGIPKNYDNTDDYVGEVHLKDLDFSKYPYMDSFYYLDNQNGVLYSGDSDEDDHLKLRDTNGGYESNSGRVRDIEGDWIDEDDARWCDDVDGWVYYENAYWLDYKDMYVSDRCDVKYSEYHQADFLAQDVIHNEETGDYYYPGWGTVVPYNITPDNESYIPKEYISYYIEVVEIEQYKKKILNYSRRNYVTDPYTSKLHYRFEMIDGRKYEDILDDQIKSELGLPDRLKTEELEEFIEGLVDDIIKNKELVKTEIKSLRDVYKRREGRLDEPWFYYLAPIIYNIAYNDCKGIKRFATGTERSKALEKTLEILNKLEYDKKKTSIIKTWLTSRFGELYWTVNISTVVDPINPTFFGDIVYKKCLYLSI